MTKEATTEFVALEHGRTVAVHEMPGGDDDVVLMFHPAPGAGLPQRRPRPPRPGVTTRPARRFMMSTNERPIP